MHNNVGVIVDLKKLTVTSGSKRNLREFCADKVLVDRFGVLVSGTSLQKGYYMESM